MSPKAETTIYTIFQIIRFKAAFFPRKLWLLLGRLSGFFFYLVTKRYRSVALKNIAIALKDDIPFSSKKKLARASFAHFGEMAMDLVKISVTPVKKRDSLLTISGAHHIREAAEKGRGLLIVTAHYGNWEIGIIGLSRLGNVHVIARALDNERLEQDLLNLRESFGAGVIYKDQATRPTLQALRKNGMVAILIDQNVLPEQAVFVDFFGKKAATTPSLAAFHLRTKAPIIPAFCFPGRNKTYHLELFPPVRFDLSGEYDTDVITITQACTNIIEAQIRKNPRYWLWFHDRWRTQPPPPPYSNGTV